VEMAYKLRLKSVKVSRGGTTKFETLALKKIILAIGTVGLDFFCYFFVLRQKSKSNRY
jgi:hypothetical protein